MARRMISLGDEFRVVTRPVQKATPTAQTRTTRPPRTRDPAVRTSGQVDISPAAARELDDFLRSPRTRVPVSGDGLLWVNHQGEVHDIRDAERLDRVGVEGVPGDYTRDRLEAIQGFARHLGGLLGDLRYQFDTDRVIVSRIRGLWRVRMRRWSRTASCSDLLEAARIFDQSAWNRQQCVPLCTLCGRTGRWYWSPLWSRTAVGVMPACPEHRPPESLLGYAFPAGELAVHAYNQVELFLSRETEQFENAKGMLLNGQHVAGLYGDGLSTSVSVWCVDGKAWLLTTDNILRLGDLADARRHFAPLFRMQPVRLPTAAVVAQQTPPEPDPMRPNWYATSVQALLDQRRQREGSDGQGL